MKLAGTFVCIVLSIFAGSIILEGCRRTGYPAQQATALPFILPAGFPQAYNYISDVPHTEQVFALGRKLFYEGRLSKDGNFSCGSCHNPETAFTTAHHDRSHGYGGSHTLRNAPALSNLAWYPEFFWDGSRRTLDDVIRRHIEAPDEMAENMPSVLTKLRADTTYRRLFREAWGEHALDEKHILGSLRFFLVQLISAGAKYDRVRAGSEPFTAAEANGYALFKNKCAGCHREPLFTDFSYRNTGWPEDPLLRDAGRMRFTGSVGDSLKFRVPSLRNIAFTDNYLHDGRIATFRTVIEHYKNPVPSATLDPALAEGISLTAQQETDLVAFLFTLSDSAFVNNPAFRKP